MDTDRRPNTLPRAACLADSPHPAHSHTDVQPPLWQRKLVWCEGVAGADGLVPTGPPSLRSTDADPTSWTADERRYGEHAPTRAEADADLRAGR